RMDKKTAAHDWALALQQDQPRLWLARGRRHAELKQWEKADADLAKAAKLKADDQQVWAERGRVYAEHGQPDKAAADFAKALDLMAEPKEGSQEPAGIHTEVAERDDVFGRVLKGRPNEKRLWIARAHHLARTGRWKE